MKRSTPLSAGGRFAAAFALVVAIACALAFLTATPDRAHAAEGDLIRGTVTADLALYEAADASLAPVEYLPVGMSIQALDMGDGWYSAKKDGALRFFNDTSAFALYTASDSSVYRGAVVGGDLDLYKAPSANTDVIWTLRNGSAIQFCKFNDSFYTARLSDGSICYIDSTRVSLYEPTEEGTLQRWAGESGARVFAAPDQGSTLIATFPAGYALQLASFNAEWLMANTTVDGERRTVFIPASDVLVGEPVVPAPEPEPDPEPEPQPDPEPDPEPDPVPDPDPAPEPTPSQVDWIITTDSVNGRAEATTDSAIVTTFRKGAVLNGLDTGSGWYKVVYNGEDVYVHGDYAKVIPPSNYTSYERPYGVSLAGMVDIQDDGTWIVGNSASNKATTEDLRRYMDPASTPAGTSGYFQFLILNQPIGVSVDTLNAQLVGRGVLAGQGQAFHDAAYAYNINEAYLVAQAAHETGNGTSTLATGVWYVPAENPDEAGIAYTSQEAVPEQDRARATLVYNMYGIGAVDSNPLNGGAKYAYDRGWTTVYDAIYGGAAFIGRTYFLADAESTLSGQNTLYKMLYHPEWVEKYGEKPWHQYATDVAWANAQTYYITQMLADYDNYTLTFEVPVYAG